MRTALLIAKLTFAELRKNKWIVFISSVFCILIVGLSLSAGGSMEGIAGFDRLSATVLNLALLFVPLVGFLLGAQILAGDRESGALIYLLSHPVKKRDIFLGKLTGAFAILSAAFSIGFGLAALFVAYFTFDGLRNYSVLWGFSLLFAFLCLAVGMFISAISTNRTKALGLALFAWLAFTMIGDLGLLGTSVALNLETEQVVALVLVNPLETFKVLLVKLLADNLEVLGTGGIYFDTVLGSQMVPFLSAWLIIVAGFFTAGGLWLFLRQEEA